jgi:hypothetical protein
MRLEEEWPALNQALRGIGHRPSVAYLALVLNRVGFERVYAPLAPPRFDDFDWQPLGNLDVVRDGHVSRAVVIASRSTLDLDNLGGCSNHKAAYLPAAGKGPAALVGLLR